MQYLHWKEQTIADFSLNNIESMYEKGFVFTRIAKGVMHQTRSLRLNLEKFELSSENRRIQKKLPDMIVKTHPLPLKDYHFSLGKLAKDFYDAKFGSNIMSVHKVKEMLTEPDKSNFNTLFEFVQNDQTLGFTITYSSPNILHYSYPFYDLKKCPKDTGLAMMINVILSAKNSRQKFVYLGSLQRPNDTYKLQFSGLEWFDGQSWRTDLEKVKKILG